MFLSLPIFLATTFATSEALKNYYRTCDGLQLKLAPPLTAKLSLNRCGAHCLNKCMGFRYIEGTCELDDRNLPSSSQEAIPNACYKSEFS